MAFLKGYPQLKLRSKIIYAKERLGGEEMSPFINGDRFVYISPDVSPPSLRRLSFLAIHAEFGTHHRRISVNGVPHMDIVRLMWTYMNRLRRTV